ncbi:hypothetical protein JXI42_00040 [bacterium]|nr:hypothetical protein [bacterium]
MKKFLLILPLLIILSCGGKEKVLPPEMILPEKLRTLENVDYEIEKLPSDIEVTTDCGEFNAEYMRCEFLGGEVYVEYPTSELIKRLEKEVKKNPEEPKLYLKLAEAQIRALKFADAEKTYFEYAEIEPDRDIAYHGLIDFYKDRLAYERAFEIYEKYFEFLKKNKEKEKLLLCFYDMVELVQKQLLDVDYDKYFKEMIGIFPDDIEVFSKYIDYLVAGKGYEKALDELKRYRNKYDDAAFFVAKKADILFEADRKTEILPGLEKEIEQLSFVDLFRNREVIRSYISNRKRLGEYWNYKEALEASSVSQSDKNILILYSIHLTDYEDYKCKDLLDSWLGAKKASFKDLEKLEILGELYLEIEYFEDAFRCFYNTYLLNCQDKEAVLYKLFQTVNRSDKAQFPFGTEDLSGFMNSAFWDVNPGVSGGILSLDLNVSGVDYKTEDLIRTSRDYFNFRIQFGIYGEFREEYPGSAYLPEVFMGVISSFAAYDARKQTIQYARQFIEKYDTSHLVYEAYRYIIRSQEDEVDDNLKLYETMLETAVRRDEQDNYKKIFDECVNYLVSEEKYVDAIGLYWNEIEKYPQNESIYLEFLSFLNRLNLIDEELSLYNEALKQFNSGSWYDKLARFHFRQKKWSRFRKTVEEVVDELDSEDVTEFLQSFVSSYYYQQQQDVIYDMAFYEKMHQKALERFPFNEILVERLLGFYEYYGFIYTRTGVSVANPGYYRDKFFEYSKLYFCMSGKIRRDLLMRMSQVGTLQPLGEMMKNRPLNLGELLFMGEYYCWNSEYEDGLPYFLKYAAFYPGNKRENEYAASLLRSLDQSFLINSDKYSYLAIGINRRLSMVYPSESKYYVTAGEILVEMGKFEEAFSKWNQMLFIARGDRNLYLELATLYWDYYQFEQSLSTFQHCREVFDDGRLFGKQVAAVYESDDDYENALREYVKLVVANRYDYSAKQRLSYLMRARDFGEQVHTLFRREIEGTPGDYLPVMAYGEFLEYIGEQGKKTALYRESISDHEDAYFLDEVLYYFQRMGLVKEQEMVLTRLVKLYPLKRNYIMLANFYEENGDNESAVRTYQNLINQYKDHNYMIVGIYQEAGEFCWRVKRYDKALEYFKESAYRSKDETKEFKLNELAEKYIERDMESSAREILELLIETNPIEEEYYRTLAGIYEKTDDYDKLIDLYNKGIEEVNKSGLSGEAKKDKVAAFRLKLIESFEKLKRFTEAQDQYIEIVNRNPLDEALVTEAYRFSKDHGLGKRMLEFYEKTAKEAHKNYRWNAVLACLYKFDGEFQAAAAELEKAIKNEPQKVWLYKNLADLYLNLNQNEKLVDIYEKLYRLTNGNSFWLQQEAEAYKRTGDLEKAKEILYNLLTKTSKYDEYFMVARTLYNWRLYGEADLYLEKGIERLKSNLYSKSFAKDDIELLVDIKLARSGVVEVYKSLVGLWSVYENEVLKYNTGKLSEGKHFEMWKVFNSKGNMERIISSYFAEIVKDNAGFKQVNQLTDILKNEIKTRNRLPDWYYSFSEAAGLTALQEAIAIKNWQSRGSNLNNIYYILDFYGTRLAYAKCILNLEKSTAQNESWRYTKYLKLAFYNWLDGNKKNELNSLKEIYSKNGRHHFQDYLFGELYDFNKGLLLTLSPRIELANFMIEKKEKASAIEILSKLGESPVWVDTKQALVYAYFKDYSQHAEEAFLRALNVKSIGDDLKEFPVDKENELYDHNWFNLGCEYGKYLYGKGDRKRVADFISSMLEDHPVSAYEYKNLGDFYAEVKEYQPAEEEYDLALALAPGNNDVFISKAELYFDEGDTEKAKAELGKIISGEPHIDLYVRYFELMEEFGFAEEGLSALKEKIVERYMDFTTYGKKHYPGIVAQYYVDKGAVASAVSFYTRLCDIDPALLESYTAIIESGILPKENLKVFYEKVLAAVRNGEKFTRATEIFWKKKAIEYYIKTEDYGRALELVNEFEKAGNMDDELYFTKARILMLMGDKPAALKLLGKWLEEQGENQGDYNDICRFFMEMDEEALADSFKIEFYEERIARGQRSRKNYLELGEFYYKYGKRAKADSILTAAYKLIPEDLSLVESIASVYEESEAWQDALEMRELYSAKEFDRINEAKKTVLEYRTGANQGLEKLHDVLGDQLIPRRARLEILDFYLDYVSYKAESVKDNQIRYTAQKMAEEAGNDYIYGLAFARLNLMMNNDSVFVGTMRDLSKSTPYPQLILTMLADYFKGKGEAGKAMELYKQAIYYEPGDFTSKHNLFEFLFENKKYVEALSVFKEEIIRSENYFTEFGYWFIYDVRYWLENLDLDEKERASFAFRIGKCYQELGFVNKAIAFYELEREFAPELRKEAIDKVIANIKQGIEKEEQEKSKILKLDESLHIF